MNKNGDNKNKNKDINKKLKSMKKALKEVSEAFEHSPNNPQLLVLMANFIGFSFKGTKLIKKWAGTAYDICQKITKLIDREPNEYDILSGLDQKAVLRRNFNVHSGSKQDGSDTLSTCIHPLAKCQAEACYVIGKMYHCGNDFNEAIKWYYKSVVLSPYFILSLFGLSQMYIFENKLDHAKICLERILKINKNQNKKDDSNVLCHYAFVCRKLGDVEIAKENLEKACKLNPNNANLWIDLAEITEQSDPQYSINRYMKAKSILLQQKKIIPFELYNNIIVLFYKLKQFEKAKKLSQELIELTNESNNNNNNNDKIPHNQVVIQYNYARILDELCEYKKARKIYRQILITQPSFIEATLCNALYLYRSGKYKEAINKFEEAAKKAQEYGETQIQLDAYLYIHRINTQIGKRHDAEKILRQIDDFRKKSKPSLGIQNDEYSELISANYILSYHRNRHNQNYYKRIHESLRRFQQVLVTNQNNIYAVHGIGVVAAESAELNLSKSILSKLKQSLNFDNNESSSLQCNADMMVNLGHVYSAYQQWDNALKCYEKAKKKLKPHELGDIPLYIVRTLFAKKDFINAKLKLHQILRFNPTQELYLYNLALIEEEYACDILRKDPKKRTLKEVENVMKMLQNAKRLYKRLDSNKKTYAGIPQEKLKQHLDHIRNELLQNAQKHLEFQRSEQERKEKKREQERRKLEKSIEKEKRKQFEKEQEEKRQNERLKQKAREVKQRGRGIVFHVPDSNGRGGSGPSRKRRRKQSQQNNDDMDQGPPTKKQRGSMADHMDQFGDRDNDDNNNSNYNKHNRFNDEDDEDGGDYDMLNEEQVEKKKLKKNKKKKKKKHKGDIDEAKWVEMEIKIEDIVRNSDLNTLTNRQVKAKLSEFFPNVNIKAYKSRIKEKINEVAKTLQEMSQE